MSEERALRRAVYPASFDPITNGHVDIARRAAAIFDEVIVAVYDTPAKSLVFTTDERVTLCQDALKLAGIENARVAKYSGLTTDFAHREGAQVLIRGLRGVSDFDIEFQQALMYRKLAPDIEVLLLMADLKYTFLSSSIVREVARLGGNVSDIVPPNVLAALREKFDNDHSPAPVPRHLHS